MTDPRRRAASTLVRAPEEPATRITTPDATIIGSKIISSFRPITTSSGQPGQ
jgi:hypothetical protein